MCLPVQLPQHLTQHQYVIFHLKQLWVALPENSHFLPKIGEILSVSHRSINPNKALNTGCPAKVEHINLTSYISELAFQDFKL